MNCNQLLEAIHEWRKERNGLEYPSVIEIHYDTFNKLMSDKKSLEHVELLEDDSRIIGHQFNKIPLAKTKDVEGIKIYSKEEHEREISKRALR